MRRYAADRTPHIVNPEEILRRDYARSGGKTKMVKREICDLPDITLPSSIALRLNLCTSVTLM